MHSLFFHMNVSPVISKFMIWATGHDFEFNKTIHYSYLNQTHTHKKKYSTLGGVGRHRCSPTLRFIALSDAYSALNCVCLLCGKENQSLFRIIESLIDLYDVNFHNFKHFAIIASATKPCGKWANQKATSIH